MAHRAKGVAGVPKATLHHICGVSWQRAARYWAPLNEAFLREADTVIAAGQQAYMKGRFRFFGIKAPRRRVLMVEFLKAGGMPAIDRLEEVVRYAWGCEEREMHYAALELLARAVRREGPEHLPLAEDLVLTNSWWDTVDPLAVHVAGNILYRHRSALEEWNIRWMDSGDRWCQRVALIFQLQWKEHTDTGLLFGNCERLAAHPDFFIRKGIGWALRQYARTDKEAVKRFVDEHELSALSVREALKHF